MLCCFSIYLWRLFLPCFLLLLPDGPMRPVLTLLRSLSTQTSLRVQLAAQQDLHFPVLYHEVRHRHHVSDGTKPNEWSSTTHVIPAGTRMYNMAGLEPNTTYDVIIRAHNRKGPSVPSHLVMGTTLLPGNPSSLFQHGSQLITFWHAT